MNIFQAIVYGIVQGLTEFLPISSNAHLRVVPALLGWNDPGAAFTAIIQLGTVLAVVLYFWNDLGRALKGWVGSLFGKGKDTIDARMGWAVFWATIPIVIVGLLAHKFIEGAFRSLYVIAGALIVNGLLMLYAERKLPKERNLESVTVLDGVKVGLWQCLSLIPGMSRSGSTINGAYFLRFDRASAARFSFLMSVPSITAAGAYEAMKDLKNLGADQRVGVAVALVVSFLVGYASIKWLIDYLQRSGTTAFVAYRVFLGVVLIALCALGVLKPTEEKLDRIWRRARR